MQRASLPLRGKRPEFVAYHWWKQIQKEMSYHAALEQITVKQLTPRITIPKVNDPCHENAGQVLDDKEICKVLKSVSGLRTYLAEYEIRELKVRGFSVQQKGRK